MFKRSISLFLFFSLPLGACDNAGPSFQGGDGVTRTVQGATFTLRRRENVVEAIRTSPEWLPKFPDVARKAASAAHQETGCLSAWVTGDESMLWIGLSCDGRPAPKRPIARNELFCDIEDLYQRGDALEGYMVCSEV